MPPIKGSRTLKLSIGEVPASGFSNEIVSAMSFLTSGEMTIEAFLRRNPEGKMMVTVLGPGTISIMSHELTAEQEEQLSNGNGMEVAGVLKTDIIDKPGPLRLLRLRFMQPGPPNRAGETHDEPGEPGFGILIWLQ